MDFGHTPGKHVVRFGDNGVHDILYSVKWRTLKVSIPCVCMNDTESAIGIEMKRGYLVSIILRN